MDDVDVTVVIPFYSRTQGLLRRAVKSVLDQSYQGFKIIIVDDCSPVSVESELEGLSEERINIIKNKKNMNGAYSRNKGVEVADTTYVALLDADDFYLKEHLFNCLENIEDNDFVYSNIVWFVNGRPEYRETSL